MQLTKLVHPITEVRFGEATRIDGATLLVNRSGLIAHLRQDERLADVEVETVAPQRPCRLGAVFDIVEPRAKEPGDGYDFPGVLGPMAVAGSGSTHVLSGAAVTTIDPLPDPGPGAKILEMDGEIGRATPYGALWHVVIVPRPVDRLPDHAVRHALRLASVKAAAYLGRAAIGHPAMTSETLATDGVGDEEPGDAPKIAFIGQILAQHRYIESEEPILYGHNTHGMVPVVLHPNEWLDGAIVTSYRNLGVETYFYQNHPIILELLKRHQAGELRLVGTVATVSALLEVDRDRNSVLAAHIARDVLKADGVILTSYGGGAPHADMGETARLCEAMGLRTAVLVSEMSRDRRAESASIFSYREVDAAVCIGGADTSWDVGPSDRVIAARPDAAELLRAMRRIDATALCGATNQQGASRIRAFAY